MFDHYSSYMIGMHAFGWLFWSALVAVLIFLGVRSSRQVDNTTAKESPLDILKRRLAAGDITPEDYEQRKALLDRDK